LPLYEYQCPCGIRFEAFNSVENRETTNCPECGGTAMKIMSVVHHTFGWRFTEKSHERFEKDEVERNI